jgi:hypothetical protein
MPACIRGTCLYPGRLLLPSSAHGCIRRRSLLPGLQGIMGSCKRILHLIDLQRKDLPPPSWRGWGGVLENAHLAGIWAPLWKINSAGWGGGGEMPKSNLPDIFTQIPVAPGQVRGEWWTSLASWANLSAATDLGKIADLCQKWAQQIVTRTDGFRL